MQIISNIALISINETLIIQLISFLVFLFILNKVMIQPLRGVAQKRENHIQTIKEDAQEAEQEIDRLLNRIRKQEAEVIRDAHKIREQIEGSGKQEADDIIGATQKEVELLSKEHQQQVAERVADAKKSIQKEAEVLAVGMMERLLERRITS